MCAPYRAPLHRRTCSQCGTETQEFNEYQPRGSIRPRLLDDMLALPLEQRREHSFLCQGGGHFHGPLAMAVPEVVAMDMKNVPADRWHGIVDMIDDLLGVVREGLKSEKLAKVCLRTGLATQHEHMPGILVFGHASSCQHMPSICQA